MEKILALKAKLASGEITQEQFATEVAALLAANEINQGEHDEALKPDEDKPLTRKEIEALLEKERQSAGDKVRTEYAQKLAEEKKARELLELEKMTAEQQAEFKRKQLESDLAEREKSLNAREVEISVVDELTAAKLPLSFKPFFVNSTTKEDAATNIKALAGVWTTELKLAVEARFADIGDKGRRGGGGGGTVKKWTDYTLTEQGNLIKENPEQAKQLAAASGVTLRF